MIYKWVYKTPDGFDDMLMNSDGEYLTGLWFIGSRDASKLVNIQRNKQMVRYLF